MNNTLEKCECGKDIQTYSIKYVIDPMKQVFVCRECWLASKHKAMFETETCCKCGKALDGEDFIDHRFCLAPDNEDKTEWNLFCIECQPYQEMVEKH